MGLVLVGGAQEGRPHYHPVPKQFDSRKFDVDGLCCLNSSQKSNIEHSNRLSPTKL
jgi:hypothetical protein